MITLLVAFVLYHFDATWPWWTAFGIFMVGDILVAIESLK